MAVLACLLAVSGGVCGSVRASAGLDTDLFAVAAAAAAAVASHAAPPETPDARASLLRFVQELRADQGTCDARGDLIRLSAALDLHRIPLAAFIKHSHADYLRRQNRSSRSRWKSPEDTVAATLEEGIPLEVPGQNRLDKEEEKDVVSDQEANNDDDDDENSLLEDTDDEDVAAAAQLLRALPPHPDTPHMLILVYVDPGCGYSRRFLPTFDLLSLAFPKIQFVKFNAAYEHRRILGSSSLAVVRGFPSLYLFHRGEMRAKHLDLPERNYYTVAGRLTNLTSHTPQPLPFQLGDMGWNHFPPELDQCHGDPLRELAFVDGGPLDSDPLPQHWDVWLSLLVLVSWVAGSLLGVGQNEEADPEDPVPQPGG